MKKGIYTFIVVLLIESEAFAQSCNLVLKDGMKYTVNIESYVNPLMSDQKFLKAKEDKKIEQIVAYNGQVSSGTIDAAKNYPMVFTIKKTVTSEGDDYAFTYNVGGKDYTSYVACKNDTLYINRNRGLIEVPDGKGGLLGFTLQGTQTLPMKLKVGDVLPTFEDIAFTFPTTTDITVKKQVFDHMATKTTSHFGYATDSRTGETGFGEYTKTTTNPVYKTIDVAVRQSLSFTSHNIQFMNARVTGEEDLNVKGVKYHAYIVESESWSKGQMKTSYESADEEVNRAQQAASEKAQGKVAKIQAKKGFTNSLGYIVLYSKQWIVPQLGGSVKTESYDMFGGIASIVKTIGLE